MILCSRLEHWFTPFREKAEAQRGPGCLEHIVSKIIHWYCKEEDKEVVCIICRFQLGVWQSIRPLLLTLLTKLGCGTVVLGAITRMYQVTQSVMATVVFSFAIGVRQWSPTNCLLFISYVNDLIKLRKITVLMMGIGVERNHTKR